jgi:uncharacterized phage-associated protein/TPR repeat protein
MFSIRLNVFYMMKKFIHFIVFVAFSFTLFAMESEEGSKSSGSSGDGSRVTPPKKRLRKSSVDSTDILVREDENFLSLENKNAVMPVADVGRIFLQFAKDFDDASMGKMKLHKLCYYAQSYSLALSNTPLYREDTCAEEHGPFEPDLRVVYDECTVDSNFPGSLVQKTDADLTAYQPDVLEYLRRIYDMKKGFTGAQLRNKTHEERPWLTHYKGQRVVIKKDELKDFFSSPAQVTGFLREILGDEHFKKDPLEQLMKQIFQIKCLLRRIHDVEKIVGFDDELLPIVRLYPKEHFPHLAVRIDHLIDWKCEDLSRQIVGYLFFPSELTEGHTPLANLFLNFSLHWKLAYAARYGHPLGQFYFSKLLEHFETLSEKSALFLKMAQAQFEKISSDEEVHPYLRGLAFKYLDKESESFAEFSKGDTAGHYLSTYELAKIMDRKGEDGVFEAYEKASPHYPLAVIGRGHYEETDDNRFKAFKSAGASGIGEGYYQIGKMMEEGFVMPEGEEPRGIKDWFLMAAENGSLDALLKLAQDSEEEGNDAEALKYYRALSLMGSLRGHLEKGRILENRGLHEQAKGAYQKASWIGLYEIAKLEPSSRAVHAKEEAEKLLKSHFEKLVRITEGVDEDE